MRLAIIDPTAGERARLLRLHPAAPRRVSDPTSPRWGLFIRGTRNGAPDEARNARAAEPPIVDPTNPAYGEPAA